MGSARSGTVCTEGDALYYEVRGEGASFLMIPPAGGDGSDYLALAEELSDAFQVILYDRRGNARSTCNAPQNFEISQQSRDAAAVLQAVGVTRAHVFGVSSGAVIALDMAKTQSQAVLSVLAYEPATPYVVPGAPKLYRHFANSYLTGRRFGASLGALQFMLGIHVPVMQLIKASQTARAYAEAHRLAGEPARVDNRAAVETLIFHELLPVTNYQPDIRAIRQNEVCVRIGAGSWAIERATWLAEAATLLAAALGQEVVAFPGHHGGYMVQPAEWAAILKRLL